MKPKKETVMIITFSILTGVMALSCFGAFGTHGQIEIVIPNADAARSLEGYDGTGEVSIKGTVVYGNAGQGYTAREFYSGSTLTESNNSFVLTNIPTGTYIFGILIQDSNDIVIGLAIKQVVISAGINNVPIRVGPGIESARIGSIDFGTDPIQFMENNKDKYSVTFGEDRISFIDKTANSTNHPDNSDVEVSFIPIFSKNNTHEIVSAKAFLIDESGNVSEVDSAEYSSDGKVTATVTKGKAGVRFKLYDSLDSTAIPYVYDVYLKDIGSN